MALNGYQHVQHEQQRLLAPAPRYATVGHDEPPATRRMALLDSHDWATLLIGNLDLNDAVGAANAGIDRWADRWL